MFKEEFTDEWDDFFDEPTYSYPHWIRHENTHSEDNYDINYDDKDGDYYL